GVSDNPVGAENQQERLADCGQNPQRPYAGHPNRWDEEMVQSARRRAGLESGARRHYQVVMELAKFLVGQVPTRTNGVTSWALSRTDTRRNCNTCEDT